MSLREHVPGSPSPDSILAQMVYTGWEEREPSLKYLRPRVRCPSLGSP